jgi:hypothetical protein
VLVLTSRGGSVAGPKPGRVSFYRELGRVWPAQDFTWQEWRSDFQWLDFR